MTTRSLVVSLEGGMTTATATTTTTTTTTGRRRARSRRLGVYWVSREYAKAVGARLRAIRIQQGLSLQGVEQKSRGRWKTAAVGSYERGDRMISVHQLSELAGFYGVPVSALLPNEDQLPPRERRPRTVLNLEKLAEAPADATALVRRWVAQIQRQRDDYAGRVLSIRDGDLRALALLYDTTPQEFADRLRAWGVLETSVPERDEPE